MRYWKKYLGFIEVVSGTGAESYSGREPWRTFLFLRVLAVILPLSIFAVVPGIIMAIHGNIPIIAVVDAAGFLLLAYITLGRVKIELKKFLFTSLFYILTIFIIVVLGPFGPGLLFLLSLTILIALIYSTRSAGISIIVNMLLTTILGIIIHFDVLVTPFTDSYTFATWMTVSINLLVLSSGIVAGLHFLLKSLHKAVNVAAERSAEMEQFVYDASHDLKEPVRSMATISGMYIREYDGKLDEKQKEYLNYITLSANRMQSLIKSLLDYSKTSDFPAEDVNPNEVLEEVLEDLKTMIEETKAKISYENFPSVRLHPVELKQLFQNLIVNGIKFRKKGEDPIILITAKRSGNQVIFSVKDNGIGVEPEYRDVIFEVFRRLLTREQVEGSGIGLAHCKKIVKRLGGDIWLESEPEKGSTFHFSVPTVEN